MLIYLCQPGSRGGSRGVRGGPGPILAFEWVSLLGPGLQVARSLSTRIGRSMQRGTSRIDARELV